MCGILGLVGRSLERNRLKRMLGCMRHRGPDAVGLWTTPDVTLAHVRLTILDPSAEANQPFVDSSAQVSLVFNGEIFNYLELRRRLIALGHSFQTTGDTEVLLRSYLQWGERCVHHLNGMFAFAIWNARQRSLFLARDRFGKKPLYYALLSEAILFSSELKPFLASGLIDTQTDAEAIVDYLHLNYILGPKSPLKQVRQLPPAHCARWQSGQWTNWRYWDLADSVLADRSTETASELTAQLESLLLDATRLRLFSDVPLGAFLSGGLDSSMVVAAIRRLRRGTVHTFSAGFADPAFNEEIPARHASQALGSTHHPLCIDTPLVNVLPEFVRRLDTPLGDDSAISTYLLSRWARRRVTVALTGDGADELFAGYETYRADALHRRLGTFRRPCCWLLRNLGGWLPEGGKVSRRFRMAQFAEGLRHDSLTAHFSWRQVAQPRQEGWLSGELERACRGYDPVETFRAHERRVAAAGWLDRMLYVDCQTWLADDILVKVDRASMAASLECRSPFLDYRVAEFAARLPAHLKLGRYNKEILRAVARPYLPKHTIARKKVGFNSPTVDWLRGPLREMANEVLTGGCLETLGLRRRPLLDLWQRFQRGERRHQYSVWGLLCLGLWQRHVIEETARPTVVRDELFPVHRAG